MDTEINKDLSTNPEQLFVRLVEYAYRVADGIGIQKRLVDFLVSGKEMEVHIIDPTRVGVSGLGALVADYRSGMESELLDNPDMLVLNSNDASSGIDPNFFGDAASQRIRDKRKDLEDFLVGIYRSEFRNLGLEAGSPSYNPSPLTNLEVIKIIENLGRQGLIRSLTQQSISEEDIEKVKKATDYLMGSIRTALPYSGSFFADQTDTGLALTGDCVERAAELKHSERFKDLYTHLHIGKLELMVDVVESAMATAMEAGFTPPEDFSIAHIVPYIEAEYDTWLPLGRIRTPTKDNIKRSQESWKNFLKEDLPNIYQLLDKAKESITAARVKYPVNDPTI